MHAQTVVLPVIWDAITLMWRHCNVSYVSSHGVRVKCFSPYLNFSVARVPAMTSKQKMNQYPKSSEIDIDIMWYWRKNILSFFWSERLLHRKSNVKVNAYISLHLSLSILISVGYFGINCNICRNSHENLACWNVSQWINGTTRFLLALLF